MSGSRQLVAWMRAADLFIGKGGYNTLAEILAPRCNAAIVRGGPVTLEQSWHAERLAEAGFLRVVDAEALESGGRRAADVVAHALDDRYPQASWRPAVDGAGTCARILGEMLSDPTAP